MRVERSANSNILWRRLDPDKKLQEQAGLKVVLRTILKLKQARHICIEGCLRGRDRASALAIREEKKEKIKMSERYSQTCIEK